MLKRVLDRIKPNEKEVQYFKRKVKEVISKINIPKTKIVLGGSGARNSWLRGNYDIDIFVKFNFNIYKKKDISKILEKALKKNFKISKLHGSRDYFQINEKELTYELIPVLDIKVASKALNITDISPLHAKWVNKFDFKDDLRLSKAFCKACRCYGAESYIKGFSGYSLEILTIYYKGFKKFIKKVSKWDNKVIIDPEKHLKKPLEELNKSKTLSPLILVDPVDKNRNVCAALSYETFDKFKKYCRDYLKNPSEKFFTASKEKVPSDAVVINVKGLKGKRDVVGVKLLKSYEFILMKLRKEGYNVVNSGWNFERFWFLFSDKKLGKYKIQEGPKKQFEKNLKDFKKKHKKIYFDGERSYAKVLREYKNVKSFLRFIIKSKEVRTRVSSIKVK